MKCLIIAAGRGSRLQLRGNSKPLIPVLGTPLIERVIGSAKEAGIDDFIVVTGYRSKQVTDFLSVLSERTGTSIKTIVNDEWEKENGISVLKAKELINDPFLLLMADHIVAPSALHRMIELPVPAGEIILGVDTNLDSPNIDLDDVTKVRKENGKICEIGKALDDYNCFDTGIFICTSAIFDAIELSEKEAQDTTLSGGIRMLALEKKANTADIGEHFWIDVDDPDAIRRAENLLLENLKDK